MILQALKDYYDRKAADPDSGIAPLGWEWKRIPFLVEFNEKGEFVRLVDTREPKDGTLVAHNYLVPSLGEAKGNGIKSNLFWENAEYFFGMPHDETKLKDNDERYKARVEKQHAAFQKRIKSLSSLCGADTAFQAVQRFLHSNYVAQVTSDPLWEEALQINQTFLMSLSGKGPIPEILAIKEALTKNAQDATVSTGLVRCLVTGELDAISRLEPVIKGVKNANPTGAHLVAVNNKITGTGNSGETPAFASFMKEQGANSPIGKRASLAYTTALNTLLGKESRQRMQIDDATTMVFWAEKDGEALEDDLLGFFDEPPKDDPDRLVNCVAQLFKSVKSGAFTEDEGSERFFVLGLAPNAARLSVRFWECATVREFSTRIKRYFDDLRIAHSPKDQEHLSLRRLLVSTAALGKTENILPNLAGNVMRAILEGLPFPESLLQATIQRVKATHDVSYPQAKLLRGCLNRKLRRSNFNKEREIAMSLDKENTNVGYCLGRLFAVLVKIQQEANSIATIREKFYASASSMPVRAFGYLMRLNKYHLAKLENSGRRVYFERLLGEIIEKIADQFPAHLSLDDQGRFAIGYYHQQRDFFTKSGESSQPAN